MLMSLTMRLCPTPPADSRGVTSVVAIPTPSFSQRAERCRPSLSIAERETLYYNGGGTAASLKSPACSPEESVLKLEKTPADSGFCLVELGDVTKLIVS